MIQSSDHVLVQYDLVLEQAKGALETIPLTYKLLLVVKQLLIPCVKFLYRSILFGRPCAELLDYLVTHTYLFL